VDAKLKVGPRMHILHRPISAVWLLFCMTHAVTSFAAGFDCAKAASQVERAICANQELSALDGDLAAAYTEALGVVEDPSKLRTDQRTWLVKRDTCLKSSPVCENVVQIYQDRIGQLRKGFAKAGEEAKKVGKSASAAPSGATTHPGKGTSPICAVLSSVDINPFSPDQALRTLSGEIEPILDDSFKAHIEPRDAAAPIEPLVFDFDNSGKTKKVLVASFSSHMNSSDTYLAYDDEAWDLLTGASFKGAIGGQYATTVFPWVWEDCKAWDARERAAQRPNWPVRTCPDPDAELPFVTTHSHGQQLHWRAAYLHLAPFTYHSATYFLLTTEDRDLWSRAFLIKPMPQGRYELICKLTTAPPI
jgi:uncharacterized protein